MDDVLSFARAIPLAFGALLPVVNPLGTAIILLGLTEDADVSTRARIAKAVSINTVLLLAAVLVAGRVVLGFFGISVPIVQLAGGLVLAAMGWQMLFNPDDPSSDTKASDARASDRRDYESQVFYPFTFPLTVGPGGVAVAITLSAHSTREHVMATVAAQLGSFVGILAVAVVTYLCLANAGRIAARLGASGMSVLIRLSAFVIVCLGAEICWSGARVLLRSLSVAG